jgi:hypothetical protein
MSCYCNLPAKSYTCLTTGYKYYRCSRTKNDWIYKHKRWTVNKSKHQPCSFRKIKIKFLSTHKTLNYSWKKWKKFHINCLKERMCSKTKQIDRKTPCLKIESMILQLYFIHEKFEDDALYVAKIEKIMLIKDVCLKYNYKWYNPRRETFQQFIEKLYKYFVVSMIFFKPLPEERFPIKPIGKLLKNTTESVTEICNKRIKFIEYISRVKPNPIDTLNSKLKKMIVENKKYRMLKRREMRNRIKYS